MEPLKNDSITSDMATPVSKSWVASRFLIIQDGGVARRRCNFLNCTKEYSRGTSHMILKRHWSKQHDEQFDETPATRGSHKVSRHSSTGIGTGLGAPMVSPKRSKRKNANDMNSGNNKNKIGYQNANSNSALKNPTNNDKAQLDVKLVSKRLKEANSIHLTFDVHTPKKGGKTFGIITAHSLSDSIEIKSVLLEYKHLPYPDDATAMFEFIRSCILRFNIREKIVSIVSNCSEVVANAIQELDKKYRLSRNYNFTAVHIKCFPQFVHLNVIEVLRSQEILIDGIRKVIGFINNSNITLRPLPEGPNTSTGTAENSASVMDSNNASVIVESGTKATGLKLPFDNRSSWNTTFNMIETFITQRGFVEPTLLYMQNPQLSNITIDWDRIFTLHQLLKPFYDVVNKFAVDNYAPVSLVAVTIPHLMDHLSNCSWGYEDLVMAAHNFKLQLESYRQFFQSDLTVIAGLLDPRVKDTFTSPEGRENAIDILRKRIEGVHIKPEPMMAHHYTAESLWARVFRQCDYDEVNDYLKSPREHGYTSNIAYWEAHKHVYPCLYVLAKTLLCVQATSVPNDRMFSAGENADRERRMQIDSTNSKELMKSWAKYLEK